MDGHGGRSIELGQPMVRDIENAPVEIVGFPIKHGDFPVRKMLVYQRVILTSLLVSMGISTFTSKELVIFCRVSKIGNVWGKDDGFNMCQLSIVLFVPYVV